MLQVASYVTGQIVQQMSMLDEEVWSSDVPPDSKFARQISERKPVP